MTTGWPTPARLPPDLVREMSDAAQRPRPERALLAKRLRHREAYYAGLPNGRGAAARIRHWLGRHGPREEHNDA